MKVVYYDKRERAYHNGNLAMIFRGRSVALVRRGDIDKTPNTVVTCIVCDDETYDIYREIPTYFNGKKNPDYQLMWHDFGDYMRIENKNYIKEKHATYAA
jgi:hypothetical protein